MRTNLICQIWNNPQNLGFNLCMEQAIAPMFIDLTNCKVCDTGYIEPRSRQKEMLLVLKGISKTVNLNNVTDHYNYLLSKRFGI
jgi:hypothetical protein